jgi:hypothetical protein
MLSGAFDLIAALVIVVGISVPGVPEAAVGGSLLAANVLVVFALMGIYACQVEGVGALGLWGFVLAVGGLLLALANFFAPSGSLLALLGLFLLAIANQRAGKLPGGGMWLWLAGALASNVAGLLRIFILISLGLALTGVGRLWVGYTLRRKYQDA